VHVDCQYKSYVRYEVIACRDSVFYCMNIFKLNGVVELLIPLMTFHQAHDQLQDQAGSSS